MLPGHDGNRRLAFWLVLLIALGAIVAWFRLSDGDVGRLIYLLLKRVVSAVV